MPNKTLKRLSLIPTLLPLLAASQAPQTYSPPIFMQANRLENIKAVLPQLKQNYEKLSKKYHIPGYAYGIVVDGQLISSGSGGYASLNPKTPITDQSVFRIASMTKSFTAMAILKLRDEGKLRLDDPITLYIPEWKPKSLSADAPAITLRHLLSHSAGLPTDDPWGDRNLADTNDDLLKLYQSGLSFASVPGTTYEYSNLGFTSLGLVIEKVSGESYQAYIAESLWQPLKMHQSTWEFSQVPAYQLVHGYQWREGKWQEEPQLHDGSFAAMGGMLTSIENFSHYVAVHLDAWPPRDEEQRGPLKRNSIREMHQGERFSAIDCGPTKQAESKAYGFGLVNTHDTQGLFSVGHSGGLPGFGSNWVILPEYGIGLIYFANLTYAPAKVINQKILAILVKNAHLKARQLPASSALITMQEALLDVLPNWVTTQESTIFAKNFFLDQDLASRKKQTQALFRQAGEIIRIEGVVASTQLSGSFILRGKKAHLKISYSLSPEMPARIQALQIIKLSSAGGNTKI